MPRRSKGPWKRAGRPGWWVWHKGKLQPLVARSEDEAWRLWHMLQAGQQPTPEGPTIAEVCDEWLEWVSHNRPAKSYNWYLFRLGKFLNHAGKDTPASAITRKHVDQWLAVSGWGPTMRAGAIVAVKASLNYAVQSGDLAANPLAGLKGPKPVTREFVYEPWQAMLAITASMGPFRPFIALMAATGARPSELAAACGVHVSRDGAEINLGRRSKTNKPRVIYVPPGQRSLVARLARAAGNGPLLPNTKGKKYTPSAWAQAFDHVRARAHLPDVADMYSFRHTWITRRVLEGVPLGVVADLAGTSLAMISRTYGHLARGDLRAAADRLT